MESPAARKDVQATVKSFMDVLRKIPKENAFDADDYARRLCQAGKSTSSLKHFDLNLLPSHEAQSGTSFDQLDCNDAIDVLTAATMARAMTNNDDRFGFKNAVDKATAVRVSKQAMCKLAPRLYGDYINQQLAAAQKPGILSLQSLRNDSAFVQEFQATIKMPSFPMMIQMHQQATNSYQYITSLMYSYQYFHHGPGFQFDKSIEDAAQNGASWIKVISNWIDRSAHADLISPAASMDVNSTIDTANLLSSLCGTVMHDEIPDTSVPTLGSLVKRHFPIQNNSWDISEQHKQLETLGTSLWSAWDRQLPHFTAAAAKATNYSSERIEPVRTTNTGKVSVDMPAQRVITYAEGAAAFLEDYRKLGFYTGTVSNREERKEMEHGVSGCFKPGTKVLTDNGEINIEDVREGIRVITRAAQSGSDSPQYGTCSDETVMQNLATDPGRARLWGFNDKQPFFSANHVFFTTTGLRAVDPVAALRENPWLEVGRLSVGHMLLHSSDGQGYQTVQIERLVSTEAGCLNIHGIHLREGLRSYHANGFLVFLNYPEITLKSISRRLQYLDPHTRRAMLGKISELQPLFEPWGVGKVSDLLSQFIKPEH
ncbi:hypothetical protein FHETE_4115 [Fusarium heterosporum]|uniref:Uncharacterized protein n=1 Tax=Fusarium heterosporum TaxID=42747 RepID=A0A8H5WUG2_FUSHE|nr:hypothetical protein FHETE_4115 [Fusarium heterosporum]